MAPVAHVTPDSDFDPAKHFLGTLCKHSHDWRSSGQSVRARSNRACRVCLIKHATKPRQERTRRNGLPPLDYLQKNIEVAGECWLWVGPLHSENPVKNYGKWTSEQVIHGKSRGGNKAHRVSYLLHHGAIPAGVVVRHRCDTPRCVNPDHLELGTPSDNSRDRDVRGRWRNWYAMARHTDHPRAVAYRRNQEAGQN